MIRLDDVAGELGVSGRTLRRAAARGLIRGSRAGVGVSLAERRYLKAQWALLAALVSALRTEPNVRFAAVYGSVARGDAVAESDVDLLVALHEDGSSARDALEQRLERRLGRHAHVVCLEAAVNEPLFLVRALEEARILVDRDGTWPRLQRTRSRLDRAQGALREGRRTRAAERLGLT